MRKTDNKYRQQDPRSVKSSLANYLALQEGTRWSENKSQCVLEFAAKFDNLVERLIIAAGLAAVHDL